MCGVHAVHAACISVLAHGSKYAVQPVHQEAHWATEKHINPAYRLGVHDAGPEAYHTNTAAHTRSRAVSRSKQAATFPHEP